MHETRCAFIFALATAPKSNDAKIEMIAQTTSNSTKVNARLGCCILTQSNRILLYGRITNAARYVRRAAHCQTEGTRQKPDVVALVPIHENFKNVFIASSCR